MELKQIKKSDVLIVKLAGDFMGGVESEKFKSMIFDAINNEQLNVVIDLSEVGWMNSTGLGILVTGLSSIRSSGGDLRLASLSERIRRPFEITRLDSIFQIYPTVDDAVLSFSK